MSDHIVKHEQLRDIANDLWTKAKARDIESISYEASTKKIKATKSQATPQATPLVLEAVLSNLASVDERTKFKKDVSVNDAGSTNNLHIGTLNGAQNQNRFSGCRAMTSKSFVDGYVNHLLVLVDDTLSVDAPTSWRVWAVKKGATRNADAILKAYHTNALVQSTVQQYTINNKTVKCAKIAIDDEFRDEVYFIVQCDGQPVRVMTNIPTDHTQDVVNLSKAPENTPNSTIEWDRYNADKNMVALCLVGRESISSLAEKIKNTQSDSSKYVLKSETTNTGGETQYAGNVVKLGDDGKINSNMIPEIAINRVLQADNESAALGLIGEGKDHLQVGDVVVLQDTNKIYIYKGKSGTQNDNNFVRDFLEISMGNGTVKSVNNVLPTGANGNVTITAEHINLSSADTTKVKTELDKKISSIALKTDNKKKLQITTASNQTSDVDLTEAFKATNITYGKTIAGTTQATVENAIDALITENGKAVKKVSGCAPDTNGNIVVTANKTDARVTLSFGTGGTDVELFSYMTTSEVEQIKGLFT